MTKLSAAINSKLSSSVIEQLERQHICTIIQFVDEDPERLAHFTGLSFKVYYKIIYKKIIVINISKLNLLINNNFYKMLILRLNLQDIIEIKQNILKRFGGIIRNALDLFEMEQNDIIPTNLSRYISMLNTNGIN